LQRCKCLNSYSRIGRTQVQHMILVVVDVPISVTICRLIHLVQVLTIFKKMIKLCRPWLRSRLSNITSRWRWNKEIYQKDRSQIRCHGTESRLLLMIMVYQLKEIGDSKENRVMTLVRESVLNQETPRILAQLTLKSHHILQVVQSILSLSKLTRRRVVMSTLGHPLTILSHVVVLLSTHLVAHASMMILELSLILSPLRLMVQVLVITSFKIVSKYTNVMLKVLKTAHSAIPNANGLNFPRRTQALTTTLWANQWLTLTVASHSLKVAVMTTPQPCVKKWHLAQVSITTQVHCHSIMVLVN